MQKDDNHQVMLKQLDSYRDYISTQLLSTQFPSQPNNLYEPVKYILELGGKRIRPILTLMACELFSGKYKNATHAALGVEVFHNFSLIHDDIMDEAPLRRGKETVHKKWNTSVGLLSGDVLIIESYKRLANYGDHLLPRLLRIYNRTAIEVCEGQQMDMDFEKRSDVSIEEYVEMIRLKTAVLLGCSLELGAIVANASEENCKCLFNFGSNLGLAFQLQDDILDVYADQSKFGKQVGGDIIANKKTYLMLTALKDAKANQLERLKTLFNETDTLKKVAGVKAIFSELDIRKKAEKQMNLFYETALNNLESIEVSSDKKAPLKAIAMYLLGRES